MSTESTIRSPAVAGSFYPADPGRLAAMVEGYLDDASRRIAGPLPKALIVPHAGYVYSGPIAAAGYSLLKAGAERIRRVVLIGPSHRVPLRGLAASRATHFETPLGRVPLETPEPDLPHVKVFEAAHDDEHSLEVQLPFLQCVLRDFRLLPLAAGDATGLEVAEVIGRLWGGEETVIVISSDLSHYFDAEHARVLDAETARAIESLDGNVLGRHSACGRVGIRGLLVAAKRRGLTPRRLDLRNSGDTAGPRDNVVGYGAWAFA